MSRATFLTILIGVVSLAQLIPENIIESVRNQTNIVDIVSQYVQLKKSGKNYLGLCPFHDEKTPSFSVAEDKQIFHCFGCGKGGNVFTFIQEIEGLNFPQSVSKVAELGNIQVEYDLTVADRSTGPDESTEAANLIKLHEKAADFYHHILLNTKIGVDALDYLINRGLDLDTIKEFKIGFSPMDRQILSKVVQQDDIESTIMEKSGLFFQTDNGDWLDRFYQRIMFPITNDKGRIVGFSGRILLNDQYDLSDQPKYLNSPETALFNKRHVLFHYHESRSTIRKTSEVILFEGFMDVIAAWKSGITNGVASMGTSLTTDQVQMLARVAETVVICYDGDRAGTEASLRAIDILSTQSASTIQLVSIPYQMDPDDYRKQYGEVALAELLKNQRITVLQFKLNYLRQGKRLDNESDKLTYIDEVLDELAQGSSLIEADLIVTQLANEFGLTKNALQSEFQAKRQQLKQQRQREHVNSRPAKVTEEFHVAKRQINQVEKAEMLLLFRLLNEKSLLQFFNERDDASFYHDVYQELFIHMTSYLTIHGTIKIADFLDYLKEPNLKNRLIELTMQEFSQESSQQELLDCLTVIKQAKIQKKIQEKRLEQQEALKLGNKELEMETTIAIIQLQRQLKNI